MAHARHETSVQVRKAVVPCSVRAEPTTARRLGAVLLLVVALALGACTGVPSGVEVVKGFDLERYLGTWYEIARLDHSFERGLSRVTATYELREKGGVSVLNRGYDADAGDWQEAEGKAYLNGEPGEGRLKVSFFGPFYGGYNIIELDKERYRWALVSGPTRSYLWILARTPDLDPAIVDRLVARAAALDFPTKELIFVAHGPG